MGRKVFLLYCVMSILLLYSCGKEKDKEVSAFDSSHPAYTSSVADMKSLGALYSDFYYGGQQEDKVFAQGKTGVILVSEIQKLTEYYILAGLESTSAKEQAIKYSELRESLYQAAIEAGFAANDEDVCAYVDNFRAEVEMASNKEDLYEVISEFKSEDDYWDFQFMVYKKDLPIQNYMNDLHEQYDKKLNSGKAPDKEWDEYLEDIKESIVEEQSFQRLL